MILCPTYLSACCEYFCRYIELYIATVQLFQKILNFKLSCLRLKTEQGYHHYIWLLDILIIAKGSQELCFKKQARGLNNLVFIPKSLRLLYCYVYLV